MKSQKVMSHAVAAGLLVGAIVGISPPLARADAGACAAFGKAVKGFEAAETSTAAPHTVFLEDGTVERRLADHAGRPVVLNFWATWCAPCVREMPDLDSLHAVFAAEGIDVLAVSEDRSGMDKVAPFYAKAGIVHLSRLVDDQGKLSRALGVRAMPTTFLFDADGRQIGQVIGAAAWNEPTVQAALRVCLRGGAGS